MKAHLFLSAAAALAISVLSLSAQEGYTPSPEVIESQREFREDRFGIFIHWGLYSMMGQGEWVMTNQNLNYKEYPLLAKSFYPVNFDAEEWVSAIKASGAKYICITSRHHDGFSLWDTDLSDYNMTDATPYGRDILKELAEECEKQDIALHFYYSLLDWGRLDYPVGRTGRGTGRTVQENPEGYFDFMKGQISELLSGEYGEIRCIWFDGDWDHDYDRDSMDWHYDEIYPLIHSLQPGCLVGNNHHLDPIAGEDIQIFERDIPGQNTAGWHEGAVSALPLETCQTMNGSWGYRMKDQNYKSVPYLIKYLVSTAGRDANLLLNVGPQPDGALPSAAIERMKAMGEWLSEYGESIYGTRSTLVDPQPWGVVTHKENKLWLHIFPDDWANAKCSETIFIPYTEGRKVKAASSMADGSKLTFKQYKEGLFVTLPEFPEETPDFIVEITLK